MNTAKGMLLVDKYCMCIKMEVLPLIQKIMYALIFLKKQSNFVRGVGKNSPNKIAIQKEVINAGQAYTNNQIHSIRVGA